jgi:hypothetical protein
VTDDFRELRARVTWNGRSATAPGAVRVDERGVECADGPAGPLRVEHVDVAAIARGDLAVTLTLFDGGSVAFDKGGSLDDLWETLRRHFLARVSASLRFAPADPRHTFDARVSLDGPGGFGPLPAQISAVRLGLNYLADGGPCAQLPFGALGEPAFDAASYEVSVPLAPGPLAPPGAKLKIGRLARRTDELISLLKEARERSLADTARCLVALMPALASGPRAALADEIRVGRMISREHCEAVAPGAWRALWNAAAGADREEYRDALESMSGGPGRLSLGMRPYGGTQPNAAGVDDAAPVADDASSGDSALPVVYVAALLPGASAEDDLLALEVLSERDHATYAYRVAPAPSGLSRDAAFARLVAVASHTLLSIDFAKEPLYLPEAEAMSARDGLYRAALHRLDNLREMRARLAGRAIHSSAAAWRAQLEKLRR